MSQTVSAQRLAGLSDAAAQGVARATLDGSAVLLGRSSNLLRSRAN